MLSLALDTCLLAGLDEYGSGGADSHVPIDLTSMLMRLLRHGHAEVLLDTGNAIAGEYRRNVRGGLGQKIIECAVSYGAVSNRGDQLSARARGTLVSGGFDPADLPFLAVSYRVGGIYCTTEEKHLHPERRALILRSCSVQVVNVLELLNKCEKVVQTTVE